MLSRKITNLTIILLILFPAALLAGNPAAWGSNYGRGNFIPQGALAVEQDAGSLVLAAYPSAELILWKPRVGDFAFVDFGLAAEGRIGIPLKNADFTVGVGGLGTMHIGFRGFDFSGSEYLDPLDLYAKVGLGVDIIAPDGVGFNLVSTSGFNYFLSDSLSVGLAYSDWGWYSGGSVNVGLRLGKKPAVKGMGDVLAVLNDAAVLTQFYGYFFFSIYQGGTYWAYDSYEAGQGLLWRYTSEGDEFFVEKGLIERESDGAEWWRLKAYDETVRVEYEFRLSPERGLTELLYRDENGMVREISLQEDYANVEMVRIDDADFIETAELEQMATRRGVKITVAAGTFDDCAEYEDEQDDYRHTYWFAGEDVPGRLVKFTFQDREGVLEAELMDILSVTAAGGLR